MRRPSRPEDSDDPQPGTLGRDRVFGAIAAALFSVALGVASVAVPLLAVRSGHGLTQVGILIAISAVSQMAARLFMGAMMRRIPDKAFVVGSALLIAVSCGLLTVSTSLLVFVVSQLLQGVARAFFWTGSQTHAVRSSASAVGALTLINLASGAGALVGPALAGFLASRSLEFSLAVGAGIGAAAVVPSLLLVRFRPFLPVNQGDGAAPQQIWRRPGVNAACWMGVTAGSWRGLLNSYVPVMLSQAGQTASAVGFLVAVANGAALLGSAGSGWVRRWGARGSLLLGVITTGVGIAAIGAFAGTAYLAACCLAVSGVGAGILQTVGPALATETVHPEERGQAIASTGTFRAAALFLAPMGMAGIVLFLPVGGALLLAGLLMTTPALAGRSAAPAPG
jgi:MFS family permease